MSFRNPGCIPGSGIRIPYVFVLDKDLKKINLGNKIKQVEHRKYQGLVKGSRSSKTLLQWQKAEDPNYVVEHKMKLDYMYYLENQVMNPILSLFEILIEKPYEVIFKELIRKYTNKLNKQSEITRFF